MSKERTLDNSRLSRWAALFSEEGPGFWQLAALVLGVVSLFRAVRLPNIWSATLMLLNYDHGFVKRGLLGATAGHWLHLERYTNFCVFSYAVLALLAVAVVALAVQSRVFHRVGRGEPVAIYAASFAVAYLGHLVGYFDIVLAALTVCVLLVRRPLLRFLLACPVCIVALLIHEMFLLVFLPAVLFSFLMDAENAETSLERRQRFWMAGALALLCVGVTLRLALRASLTHAEVASLTAADAARADFPVKTIAFTVLELSAGQNVRIMRDLYVHNPRYTLLWCVSLASFALFAWPLLLASRRVVAAMRERAGTGLLMLGAMIASLAPLSMNLIGFDNVRWNALVCLDCLLVLLVLSRGLHGRTVALPSWYRGATVLLLALGMASGEGLMDKKLPNEFPFVGSTMHLIHARMESGRIPPPEY